MTQSRNYYNTACKVFSISADTVYFFSFVVRTASSGSGNDAGNQLHQSQQPTVGERPAAAARQDDTGGRVQTAPELRAQDGHHLQIPLPGPLLLLQQCLLAGV